MMVVRYLMVCVCVNCCVRVVRWLVCVLRIVRVVSFLIFVVVFWCWLLGFGLMSCVSLVEVSIFVCCVVVIYCCWFGVCWWFMFLVLCMLWIGDWCLCFFGRV